MPPNLIHAERNTPLPWSAVKRTHTLFDAMRDGDHGKGPRACAAHGWELMAAVLEDYVTECRQHGEEVTDDKLQKHARKCLFGSDDPWNQTR